MILAHYCSRGSEKRRPIQKNFLNKVSCYDNYIIHFHVYMSHIGPCKTIFLLIGFDIRLAHYCSRGSEQRRPLHIIIKTW